VAAARHELQDLAASITGWHFDAWLWTHNSLRLPIFTLGLKENPATSASAPPPT